MRPAVRIIFAPLAFRGRNPKERTILHGQAQGRTIWIDPRLGEVAKTLLHELTHVRHPSWTEDQVKAYEELRWGKMSWREKARLYQMLGSARLEGDED